MAKVSDAVITPSQPQGLPSTPITALPAFTPLLSRTSRSDPHARVINRSLSPPSVEVTNAWDRTVTDTGAGPSLATPSFANRGFIPRFSTQETSASASSAQGVHSRAATACPLSRRGVRRSVGGTLPRQFSYEQRMSVWERHGRRMSAPSGFTETIASDGPSPSFAFQAPSGLTDSDNDDDDDAEGANDADSGAVWGSRQRSGKGAGVRALSPAELALTELAARVEAQLRIQSQLKLGRLERGLLEEDVGEQRAQQAAQQEQQRDLEAAEREEEAQRAERARQRQQLLDALRAEHDRKAREAQQRLDREEAARRQQAQRRQREAQQAKQAAEQEAQRAQQAQGAAAAAAQQGGEQKAEQVSKAVQPQAAAVPPVFRGAAQSSPQTTPPQASRASHSPSQQQQQQQQQKGAAAAPPAASDPFPLRLSPSAAQWRQHCAERLKAAQEGVRAFVEDRAMRDKKRSIHKFVTLNVQQIAATLDQVRAKGMALVNFVGQQQGAQRTYALLTLANKLVSQCEAQVTRLHSFAFPTAEVAVAVAAAHPDFVELLVGRLHQVCVLCVPGYYSFKAARGEEDHYLRLMGYKFTTDEDTGKVTKESTDDYVGRMQGYVLLLAAVTQSDNPHNPHGLNQAWCYLARLLNSLPANRITATALDAFLKVAGYRLQGTYRGQFMKLLQYVDREFLGDLSKHADPDARAVLTRIQTFLRTGRSRQAPEGRDMPRSDASSYNRA